MNVSNVLYMNLVSIEQIISLSIQLSFKIESVWCVQDSDGWLWPWEWRTLEVSDGNHTIIYILSHRE